ncbi:hypothetical protein M5D96_010394, partial [Drosophila gunungcola]
AFASEIRQLKIYLEPPAKALTKLLCCVLYDVLLGHMTNSANNRDNRDNKDHKYASIR